MSIYKCEYCNYTNIKFYNLNLHNRTKKHLNNMKIIDKLLYKKEQNDKQKEQNDKQYQCPFCNKLFTTKTSLYRHKLHFCKFKNKGMMTELQLEVENRLLKEKCIKLEENNEKLAEIAKNNSAAVTQTMSTMSYVTKHLSNAPPITQLEGKNINILLCSDKFISDCDSKNNKKNVIEQEIIYNFNKKTLDRYLGDLIIKEYKKDNPEDQSLWSSDISRLTFFIRESIGKSNSWMKDKKGINLTKLIIFIRYSFTFSI